MQPVTFNSHAKQVIAINSFPDIKETGEWFWNRFIVFPFNHYFPTDKETLIHEHAMGKKLIELRPQMMNAGIHFYRKLQENDFQIPESKMMKDALNEWKLRQNSLLYFLDAEWVITHHREDRFIYRDFYIEYEEFCANMALNIFGPKEAPKLLRNKNIESKRSHGQLMIYGIKRKTPSEKGLKLTR